MELAVKNKNLKYIHLKSKSLLFVVVAVETMRPWSKKVKEWLNQIERKIVETTGEVKCKHLLMQRVSMGDQRGNSARVSSLETCRRMFSQYF